MTPLQTENAAFKYAAIFLTKDKVDTVAQFADKNNIYALSYDPKNDRWLFAGGVVISTMEVIGS
jgi:hypothetical protein